MQCLAGAILVLLLIQNSLGQEENDAGCGERPGALNNYMRRLNNAENEMERPADPKNSETANDPKSRMKMFSYKSQAYYPAEHQEINIMPPTSWIVPQSGVHAPSMSSFSFQYDMMGSSKVKTLSNTLKYKVDVSIHDLFNRLFQLFIKWPEIKHTLKMRNTVSFRELLRAAFDCLYPEWGDRKMNMIFSSNTDEIVLKELFVAMFPNWPQREIDDIFSPTNTIPLIIKKLLLYLVPDLTQNEIDFIFSNTNSVKLILRRICKLLFPWIPESKGDYIFQIDNPVMNIFDELLQVFFPQLPPPEPIQWDSMYTLMFPGFSYNITSVEPNLLFLLTQYNNSQSIDPSKRENILMLILLEWLKQNPHIKYELSGPGMDDFEHFKRTFFQNTPPNTLVPPEFQDDNFLRELFVLWKRFIASNYPNNKQIDLQGILDYLSKFVQGRITNQAPNMPMPTFPPSSTPAPKMEKIPHTITIKFIENLGDILPPDMRKRILQLFQLPDKTKSGPLIIKILADWQKYKLMHRVPISKLMELILRIIVPNWSDADIERVVGWNLNLEQILINLFKVMFLEWPNVTLNEDASKINSPQFILEMLLKKALPHIPKQKIEAAVDDSSDIALVLRRLRRILFPDWPAYDPSRKHFDPAVLERILTEIINWPQMKATIIAKGEVSIPLLVESFIHSIFPSWPQYIVSMIIVGRTPLPLVIQKILQLIATNPDDRDLVMHYDEKSPMVKISEALFRKIFPNWPNYSAVLNIPNARERVPLLGEMLKVVHGPMIEHENSFKCLKDPDSNWAFSLFIGLLKYVEQESALHAIKMF